MPSPRDAYDDLMRRCREWTLLQSCSAVLGWDQQTMMPRGGAGLRGEQTALLATLVHDRMVDPALADLLADVGGSEVVADPESWEAADVRELTKTVERAAKLPRRLVEELAKTTTAGQEAWVLARQANDFARFRPHLESILKLKREEAAAVGFVGEPYDALLDEYEPGTTAADIDTIFTPLTAELVPLIRAVADSGRRPKPGILDRDFPIDRQKLFAEGAAAAIGFRFTEGRLDTAAHPFCSGIGPGDCRLTTRYNPRQFNEAFFGVLHEAGHGIYEQNLPAERYGAPSAAYCSLGIHESQSRLWENQIGRGEAFWTHFYPRLQQAFPGTLDDVTRDDFLFAINAVKPSFIRVEADEATYNLHIALRFELERAMLTGDLAVADLPGAWNDRFLALFGLAVPSDNQGCLQDVHWSFGGLGYFPTYTLGNLYAAQFRGAASKLPSVDEQIAAGNFAPLTSWLKEHIHRRGRRFRAAELCRRATGDGLKPESFTHDYLREKLSRFYGVC